jgi:hypothetical protein
LQEFALELADCYGCLFDIRYEALNTGEMKMSPESVFECNQWASLSIENAMYVSKTFYDTTDVDKQEYLQAIFNMELGSATKYSKIFQPDPKLYIENLKNSLGCYKRVIDYA